MVTEKIVGSTVLIRSIREDILPNGTGAVSRKLLEESCVGSSVMWLGAIHHAELLPHDHCEGRGASLRQAPRARFPSQLRDSSRDRPLLDGIAAPAPQDKRAAEPAAKQRLENNHSERSPHSATGGERAANSPRLAEADECARWPSIR